MLAALFSSIVKLATDSKDAQIVELDNGRKLLVSKADGSHREINPRLPLPDPIRIAANTIDDMVKAASELKEIATSQVGERFESFESVDKNPLIFYNVNQVSVLLDPNSRTDHVSMPLVVADQFTDVMNLNADVDQKQLIRFLRVNLHGTGAEKYVTAFKNIVWNRAGQAKGSVSNSGESLGKSIESQVATSSEEELPEVLNLSVPVFQSQELGFRATVEIIVVVDFDSNRFNLSIAPNQKKQAFDSALEEVASVIHDSITNRSFEAEIVFGSA